MAITNASEIKNKPIASELYRSPGPGHGPNPGHNPPHGHPSHGGGGIGAGAPSLLPFLLLSPLLFENQPNYYYYPYPPPYPQPYPYSYSDPYDNQYPYSPYPTY
ncbi:hypothetical protein E0485_14690 [Paenibacillus albiflavus]|uniref:Uncharacterized protein n=1 Tax=Paenibacillus albiflavus TaxID=2545760 RepID=A0A4R4EAY3_9BACL|nr:hypothetical protein [Paenibacillus albiflavus]TCZ76090.1 hypothetical protein E0485_14690 [Paenibacillus albiflavus]